MFQIQVVDALKAKIKPASDANALSQRDQCDIYLCEKQYIVECF